MTERYEAARNRSECGRESKREKEKEKKAREDSQIRRERVKREKQFGSCRGIIMREKKKQIKTRKHEQGANIKGRERLVNKEQI